MRVLPMLPMIALAPLAPGLAQRVVDGGALSIACTVVGVALMVVGARVSDRHAHGGRCSNDHAALALVATASGAALVIAGLLLTSRALIVAGAFLISGGLLSVAARGSERAPTLTRSTWSPTQRRGSRFGARSRGPP